MKMLLADVMAIATNDNVANDFNLSSGEISSAAASLIDSVVDGIINASKVIVFYRRGLQDALLCTMLSSTCTD